MVELVNEGFKVIIIDNLHNSSLKCYERIKRITGKDDSTIMLEVADLKYYAKIDEIFNQYKPTAVIHFAALKAVGESVAHPLMYYENNVGGTVNLLKAMEKHGCGTIVFSSSACVYGDNPCCKEEDPL